MDFNIASSMFRRICVVKGESAAQAPVTMMHNGLGSITGTAFIGPVGPPNGSPLNATLAFFLTCICNLNRVSIGIGDTYSYALCKSTRGTTMTSRVTLINRQSGENFFRCNATVITPLHFRLTA